MPEGGDKDGIYYTEIPTRRNSGCVKGRLLRDVGRVYRRIVFYNLGMRKNLLYYNKCFTFRSNNVPSLYIIKDISKYLLIFKISNLFILYSSSIQISAFLSIYMFYCNWEFQLLDFQLSQLVFEYSIRSLS